MKHKFLLIIIIIFIVAACVPSAAPGEEPTAAFELPTPIIRLTQPPDAESAAASFLEAWKAEEYQNMSDTLTSLTRDAITFEDFEKTYRNAAIAMTMQSMDYQVLSTLVTPNNAQVNYRVTYTTTLLGEISRETTMNMTYLEDAWRVQWEEGMILPELRGGNVLELRYKIPARGNIYDRDGNALVAQDDAVALGVVKGWIDPDSESGMVGLLARLTDQTTDAVRAKYEFAQADWYVAIGDISARVAEQNATALNSYPGILMSPFRSRYYYDGGVAPHVVGYVLSISVEDLETFQRKGYRGDEKVGASGLELWGEEVLSGTHGGSLYVKDPQGQIVTMLASSDSKPAASIYTTIDRELQYYLQRSMGDYRGAVVVVEKDTGRVLAMASNPSYDPNLFEPTNKNSLLLGEMLSDPQLPLYNRAAQGVYPLGSVFKIVTMAAALETGVFTPTYPYDCGLTWEEIPGLTLYDWTYERELPASGRLTLVEGLMRSCNPWFWHIGLTLWNQGYTTAIADLALGFGLGKETGIEIQEFKGNVEYPQSDRENVQMAIGQGTMQVSPLQVAMFVAAVGNDGTLYRPSVVEKIMPLDGEPVYRFEPEVVGQLPVTLENLQAIQDGMISVANSRRGTAYRQLSGLNVNVAGKTGTAQNPAGDSHAWFGGYTYNDDPNRPDIAVVVILENAGEGSEMAAPLFRRAVSLYFSFNSNYGVLMPWEESPYVVATPEPETTPEPEE